MRIVSRMAANAAAEPAASSADEKPKAANTTAFGGPTLKEKKGKGGKKEEPGVKLGVAICRISLPGWRPKSHIGRPKNIICICSSKLPDEAGKGKKEFQVCASEARDLGPRLDYAFPGSLGEPTAWVEKYKEGRDLFFTLLDKDTPLGTLGTVYVKAEDFWPDGMAGEENRSGDVIRPQYPIDGLAWEEADRGAFFEIELQVAKTVPKRRKKKGLSPEEEAAMKLKNDLQELLEKRARDWQEKPPEKKEAKVEVEERKPGPAPRTRFVAGIAPVTGPRTSER